MPTIQIPPKFEKLLTTPARINVIIGGRGGGKSESLARILLAKCQTERADILCGREYQNSIEDSVHKLIKGLIINNGINGFDITDKKIDCITGGGFRFRGFARNSDAVKSAQDFKYSWIEEAQSLSQKSIDDLMPTIMRNPGSRVYFTANPQSSADPFSKELIIPFHKQILKDGYYEDDLYFILLVNWRDNPWHKELEPLRQRHFETKSRAWYDHIWEGYFNDTIENPLISPEIFDSCVDAHKKIGFEPQGLRYSAHDPSDEGEDSKGYAFRHGSVVLEVCEKNEGDVNEGGDWATGLSIKNDSDAFIWDVGGLGAGLKRQISLAFSGKRVLINMFNGAMQVENPDSIFEAVEDDFIQDQKKNKEVFKNLRAQTYYILRSAMIRTHQAVNGQYHDPQGLISFDSNIKELANLRSELCRMPIKPNRNGQFELYTKQDMKAKFKFKSPNLADSVMMLMKTPYIHRQYKVVMPQSIQPKGRRL